MTIKKSRVATPKVYTVRCVRCKKEISSLYPNQLYNNVKVHEIKHDLETPDVEVEK